uniref:Uncharacterized protein n=1 Tax=Arundo donax TaxID=35708 RepID=A0A0A9HD84_ARUDO
MDEWKTNYSSDVKTLSSFPSCPNFDRIKQIDPLLHLTSLKTHPSRTYSISRSIRRNKQIAISTLSLSSGVAN